jgi:hypothetical protein
MPKFTAAEVNPEGGPAGGGKGQWRESEVATNGRIGGAGKNNIKQSYTGYRSILKSTRRPHKK